MSFTEVQVTPLSMLHSVSLIVARFFLVGWIGGAALFVMTSIAEQRTPEFDSITKDRLATVRFPLYYAYGAICLTVATTASAISIATNPYKCRWTLIAGLVFCILSATVAGYDYVAVYSPLQKAIIPPGQVRGPDFMLLHRRSALVNEIHVSLALVAAIFISLPASLHSASRSNAVNDLSPQIL